MKPVGLRRDLRRQGAQLLDGARQRLQQRSMSARVFSWPSVMRRLARATSGGTPIAVRTCEGSSEPVVQAEPLLALMPLRSSWIRTASPSTPSRQQLKLFGRRFSGSLGAG